MKTLSTITLLLCIIAILGFGNTNMNAQPTNDHITDAIDLGNGPAPYSENAVNFLTATFDGDATPNPCAIGVAGTWYTFKPTITGTVVAELLQPVNPIVLFFEGPENAQSGLELTYLDQPGNGCDTSETAEITATEGNTYYIYMKNDGISDVNVAIEEIFIAPPNDLIENATDVNGQPEFIDEVHFLLATNTDDGGQIGDCDTGAIKAIWYKFTAVTNGEVNAEINIPPSNGVVVFYSATNENATKGEDLTFINAATNTCSDGNTASIQADAGTTYYLLIAATPGSAYFNVMIDLSNTLSITENELSGFDFYPNPVTDQINLKANKIIDQVSIYNLLGQVVFSQIIGKVEEQINLSHLKSGMYLLTVVSEGQSASYKIVKK